MKGHGEHFRARGLSGIIKKIRTLDHWGPGAIQRCRGSLGSLCGRHDSEEHPAECSLEEREGDEEGVGNAFRGGGREGSDSGAGVNVNEEGECPARIANHKRQQASWAWAKDFMTFAY